MDSVLAKDQRFYGKKATPDGVAFFLAGVNLMYIANHQTK